MDLLQATIYGIVQGLTEFLPISSTAHLRIVPALLGWSDPGAAYTAIIQLGTTAAVLLYFAKDIGRIAKAWVVGLVTKKPFDDLDARMGWYVIVGTIPVVVLGLALKKLIENEFRSLYVIAFAAIGLAILLAIAEKVAKHGRSLADVTLKDAVGVGLAQAVALIPGSSRSGCTLTGGLLLGLQRDAAARFSFLLSIPATVAAGVFEMRHVFEEGQASGGLAAGPLIVGSMVSFVFGYASIAWLLRFLRTRSTAVFVVYRLGVGAAILVLLTLGFLKP
ncbi:MAG: undecaprenyl-diphosphate phosphatase [Deltaproteobacteria bacterium]|nr:undecaprenyl-diphosphate phosphatase [Deltaproteobacteria bacterium]